MSCFWLRASFLALSLWDEPFHPFISSTHAAAGLVCDFFSSCIEPLRKKRGDHVFLAFKAIQVNRLGFTLPFRVLANRGVICRTVFCVFGQRGLSLGVLLGNAYLHTGC